MSDKKCPLYFITPDHFKINLPLDKAHALFKQSISMVELEVFSYCNRTCWFCPNSTIDRKTKNILMDESTYLKVIKELQTIDYDGILSYSRYNEPLANNIILTRIKQARKRLPKATLHLNTNGDFLDPKLLARLYDSGLRSINIQVYLDEGVEYTDELVQTKIIQRINEFNIFIIGHSTNVNEKMNFELEYKDMDINIYARNFRSNGCDRGGLVNIRRDDIRTSPCLVPFKNFIIDYNGSVMPCCNLRSDSPAHVDAIIANVANHSIFDIYTSKNAVSWRKNMMGYKEKSKPCDHCHFSEITKN